MLPPIGGPIEAHHRRLLCIECPQPGVDPGHLQRPLHIRRNTQQTEGTEFGDERILKCLHASPSDIEPSELVEPIMAGVREFTVGEPQSDDITVLGELLMLDRRQ